MKLSRKQNFYLLMAGLLSISALSMPVHAKEADQAKPVATLSANATVQVDQDTVSIVLAAQESAANQADVSKALNAKLDSVMKQAKAEKDVKSKSGSYRIWPNTDRDGKISEWRGQAEIILESQDFEAASALAAKLADRMPIDGLSFSVSNEKRVAQEQDLLEQAVSAFERRAKALSTALGYEGYAIKKVNLGGSGQQITPMPKMMLAASADSAAAPIEGGQQSISVTVQGEIYLLNAKK